MKEIALESFGIGIVLGIFIDIWVVRIFQDW